MKGIRDLKALIDWEMPNRDVSTLLIARDMGQLEAARLAFYYI